MTILCHVSLRVQLSAFTSVRRRLAILTFPLDLSPIAIDLSPPHCTFRPFSTCRIFSPKKGRVSPKKYLQYCVNMHCVQQFAPDLSCSLFYFQFFFRQLFVRFRAVDWLVATSITARKIILSYRVT